mmetsp:Transcript_8130/g.27685  ORF Transcript_8130/g.27685 Transcript_8130/m.27685 type:complete len:216 (+) Transcript_8130:260-907(+)
MRSRMPSAVWMLRTCRTLWAVPAMPSPRMRRLMASTMALLCSVRYFLVEPPRNCSVTDTLRLNLSFSRPWRLRASATCMDDVPRIMCARRSRTCSAVTTRCTARWLPASWQRNTSPFTEESATTPPASTSSTTAPRGGVRAGASPEGDATKPEVAGSGRRPVRSASAAADRADWIPNAGVHMDAGGTSSEAPRRSTGGTSSRLPGSTPMAGGEKG